MVSYVVGLKGTPFLSEPHPCIGKAFVLWLRVSDEVVTMALFAKCLTQSVLASPISNFLVIERQSLCPEGQSQASWR